MRGTAVSWFIFCMLKLTRSSPDSLSFLEGPPTVKKSPALPSNAPSNPVGKAGSKKTGKTAGVKDPKQGNILSFFKKHANSIEAIASSIFPLLTGRNNLLRQAQEGTEKNAKRNTKSKPETSSLPRIPCLLRCSSKEVVLSSTERKLKVVRLPDDVLGYDLVRISSFFPKLMWYEGLTIVGFPIEHARQLWPDGHTQFW
ncbi:hypothetical protein Syun_022765 [Stephania yunnanensis]|uniref:Uncharacterized protein n=1 Tax=Stephania yunnanensis TaxID=152371 RepID=A0AAP0I3E0_9MAGN